MTDKIKSWWSDDRKWFCLFINDGVNQATVSLTPDEAKDLALYAAPPSQDATREALAEIKKEADTANDVIRLGRSKSGQGHIRVATALHRIAALASRADRAVTADEGAGS